MDLAAGHHLENQLDTTNRQDIDMKTTLIKGMIALAGAGGLVAAPAMGVAGAAAPAPIQAQAIDADWLGFHHPGFLPPGTPFHDWHCDRHGFWHNDENDQFGHLDGRCVARW